MSGRLAVDLGTSRTRLSDAAGRVFFDEPTAAAVNLRDNSLVAYGSAALAMPGRSAGEISLVRPVVRGQLQDLALTDRVADHLLARARQRTGHRPDVLCSIPGLATGVQTRALERAFKSAGAGHVEFIEQAVAAGIGFKLAIEEPVATMVVDAGAGTTDAAVMALGGVVTESSVPVGGDEIDRAVRDLLLRSFDLLVPLRVAEQVKRAVVTAWPASEEKIEVIGRDASSGRARSVVLSTSEASAAAADHVASMVQAAVSCIVTAPPDLANDLLTRGLHLCGEGALLTGFARRLATATGIPVHLAEQPSRTTVSGTARCLGELAGRRVGSRLRSAESP